MGEISTKRIATNILVIVRNKNIRVGEFEKELGLCTGYFSRLISGTIKNIPVSIIYRASKLLDVTMEDLIIKDYEKILLTAQYKEKIDILEKEIEMLKRKMED